MNKVIEITEVVLIITGITTIALSIYFKSKRTSEDEK